MSKDRFSVINQTSALSFPNYVLHVVFLGMMVLLGTAAAVAGSASLPWPWTSSASNATSIRTSASRNPTTWKQCWPSCPVQCFGWAVSFGNKRWQEASRCRPPQRWEAWQAWLGHCQNCALLQIRCISKEFKLYRMRKNSWQTLKCLHINHWNKIQLEILQSFKGDH